MTLASAQLKSENTSIDENLSNHYKMIHAAAQSGARLIVFPEMSITGYLKEGARELSFIPEDPRLNNLSQLSIEKHIIIIAGAPILVNDKLYIGAFILYPDGTSKIYTKQYLHSGEKSFYFTSTEINSLIKIDSNRISLAICADIDNPNHARDAHNNKSDIYIASIFFSKKGMKGCYRTLGLYAKRYSIPILMSNYCGLHWGIMSGGGSAHWSADGKLTMKMNNCDTGLLIINDKTGDEFIIYE